ncbi:DnaJ domain containing protein [Novymonas esmeraldas]|uniref:DnaJ domain containing protein n=1 Tax=Novymonas esmeraldas TaxID=1808958 RepID=A0AAW0EZW9_9TRYP
MEAQQTAEIARLLQCEARKASPFDYLQLDIATCELTDVNRQYRRIALLLHPDKCALANATDAFHVAEKVHKSLSQESVFYHLKRAYQRQQDRLAEEGTSAAGGAGGQKRGREGEATTTTTAAARAGQPPPIAFGSLSQLAATGLSSDAQKAAEIRRVLTCKATDYFLILDVDPHSCAVADVDRRFRKMAQALHPDKCQLPHVQEAFTVFEKAHKELAEEKKLVRFKVAFEQQRKKEAALAAAATQRGGGGGGGVGAGAFGCEEGLTADERLQKRRVEALRDQQLEAARLGEEAARRRKLKEEKQKEENALSAELERQRKEWGDLQLF